MGHHFQQRIAGTHHRAFGVHPEVDGNTVGRGEDFTVLQVKAGGGQLLLQGDALELGFGQLAAHFFLVFLTALLQVQARFDNVLLQPRAIATVLRQVALHLRQLALVVQQAVARDVALAGQGFEVGQLLTQGIGLGLQVAPGPAHAGELGHGPVDAGGQPGLLSRLSLAAAAEQLPLAFQHQAQLRIGIGTQLRGKLDVLAVIALTLPARQAGPGQPVLSLQRLHIGLDPGLVEAE
ncbi:hypothetical protein D3C84_652600 [compost metagenome]